MNITVSANNNEEILVLPIVPPSIELNNPSKNEEFDTINNGALNLIGDEGLRSFNIASNFLLYDARWRKKGSLADGWKYVEFFNKWKKARVPIRVIYTDSNNKEIFNLAATIENFNYSVNKSEKLIAYSLDLKEYRFVRRL